MLHFIIDIIFPTFAYIQGRHQASRYSEFLNAPGDIILGTGNTVRTRTPLALAPHAVSHIWDLAELGFVTIKTGRWMLFLDLEVDVSDQDMLRQQREAENEAQAQEEIARVERRAERARNAAERLASSNHIRDCSGIRRRYQRSWLSADVRSFPPFHFSKKSNCF